MARKRKNVAAVFAALLAALVAGSGLYAQTQRYPNVGLSLGVWSTFAEPLRGFNPFVGLDLNTGIVDLFLGASMTMTNTDAVTETVESNSHVKYELDGNHLWLQGFAGIAPHVVKAGTLTVDLPLWAGYAYTDYADDYTGDGSPPNTRTRGQVITAYAGIRCYHELSRHFSLYYGLSDAVYTLVKYDSKSKDGSGGLESSGYTDTRWLSAGIIELGTKLVF